MRLLHLEKVRNDEIKQTVPRETKENNFHQNYKFVPRETERKI